MKIVSVAFLCLFGSILLGLHIESFGEAGNVIMRFVGMISVIASIRLAVRKYA
ncbi:hypothetical protein [Bacillus sp. es.036]|uniref:hypothetical protein n=1 Tax=Bacillus sp. es.036 TaxID=1761764 RepID=UPI000C005D1A|nr:hypothetical protein [Bacillus sp. es.036]PFG12180.1 hypothetical protein ATG70_0355 [Bacillus sp. es.036]